MRIEGYAIVSDDGMLGTPQESRRDAMRQGALYWARVRRVFTESTLEQGFVARMLSAKRCPTRAQAVFARHGTQHDRDLIGNFVDFIHDDEPS